MKNIQISDGLHKQLKKHCAEQGLLMKFYVERLIINELDEPVKMDTIRKMSAIEKSAVNKRNTSK
jgi:hypothetical protein